MSNEKEVQQAIAMSLADSPPSILTLQIKSQFESLTEKQKLYAHHISRASFSGTRIILRQVSPESEAIYDLILALYRACLGDWKKVQQNTGISDEDLKYFLEYATQFLGNNGNYRSFGDTKIVPRISPMAFEALVEYTPEARELYYSLQADSLNRIYLDEKHLGRMLLGYPAKHTSNYYPESSDISREEIEAVGRVMAEQEVLPENTRIRKTNNGFEILVASGLTSPPKDKIDTPEGKTSFELPPGLDGKRRKLDIVFGDHAKEMATIAFHIKEAGQASDSGLQKKMMDFYAESFGSGSLKAFKESQKLWVKDIGPAVESNIGFIETLRDPAGVRAEWEGFAAIVNKERTQAFEKLVNKSAECIPLLPWSKDFEKDTFTPPDFTSLDVLSFATSGLPAGINLPNYDDIKNIGFKNVSLGNVLSAKATNEPIPFIHEEDLELYNNFRDQAFEIQVGIHELLGHGTGKLLQEISPGCYNFDNNNPPISPISNKPITTYYLPGQTWSSVFGPIASSYEECRAECVAMALCPEPSLLTIFGHGNGVDLSGEAGDVLFTSYLSMARAGIAALEYWDPKSKKWGQAHMQARYSILRVFLAARDNGEKFTWLEHEDGEQGEWKKLAVRVNRALIPTVGRKAVEDYLQKLHVYKSTADVDKGKTLYESMTEVDDLFETKVRPAVLAAKMPRKVFVQANTAIGKDNNVELHEYDPTPEGMIQSWAEREKGQSYAGER